MTELRSDWLIGYFALERDRFSSKTISINNFSSERVDSKGLYGRLRLRVMAPDFNNCRLTFQRSCPIDELTTQLREMKRPTRIFLLMAMCVCG